MYDQHKVKLLLQSIAILAVQAQEEIDNRELLEDSLGDIQSDLNKISTLIEGGR